MNDTVAQYLSRLDFGEPCRWQNMVVVPLFSPANDDPMYVALEEALAGKLLRITEVGISGSVPELKVVNEASV